MKIKHQLGDLVMPGDEINLDLSELPKTSKMILGPGLHLCDGKVVACKADILKQKSTNLFWVDAPQKRYIPCKGETVIGVIVQKAGDIFRVDIGAHEPAALSYTSFEGATKNNRPNVNVGDLVFAKLLTAHKDFESELICMDSIGKKQRLGTLSGGFLFNCGISLSRKLRNSDYPLIDLIQRNIQIPFEIVVGMNGRIWVKTTRERDAIAVANAILAAQYTDPADLEKKCNNVGEIFSRIV